MVTSRGWSLRTPTLLSREFYLRHGILGMIMGGKL